MRKKRLYHPREKGQAMVEFALILPLLLLVVYGMLEVGRLVFLYSTVVTASRQAARYGSSTGYYTDDLYERTDARYNDCAGIRAAAQNVDFLGVIEDENIIIQYDHGPTTGNFAACPTDQATIDIAMANTDRIRVIVSADFVPIVPIIPLETLTLSSSNARTIIVGVSVEGNTVPLP